MVSHFFLFHNSFPFLKRWICHLHLFRNRHLKRLRALRGRLGKEKFGELVRNAVERCVLEEQGDEELSGEILGERLMAEMRFEEGF